MFFNLGVKKYTTNIVNISASVWWYLDVLSNIKAPFEAQFVKKLSNTDAELKKNIAEYSIAEFKKMVIERNLRQDHVVLSLQFVNICIFDKLNHVLHHSFVLEMVISA